MNHTPPPMPDYQPVPAPKKPRNWVVIGSALAVIAAVIGTGVFVVNSRDNDSKPATTAASSTPTDDTVTAAAEEEPEPTYEEVTADSFTIELRTKRRQCFGSAGCNVTVEPKLTYVGLGDIDPDAVYEITYKIRGDESGPVIATAELSDETSLSYTPTLLQTASSGAKLSVEITDVLAREY